jgi:hypothetical protein
MLKIRPWNSGYVWRRHIVEMPSPHSVNQSLVVSHWAEFCITICRRGHMETTAEVPEAQSTNRVRS